MWAVIPSLRFVDLAAAVAFYRDTLGFDVVRGEPADGNVAVNRGAARMMLETPGAFYSPGYNEAIRERQASHSPHALYIEEPDLAAYHDRLRDAGVRIVDPLAERPWGQSEFTVEDLAGNWLTFWGASASG
ncbi:MAG TPA: VOC family protein [Gaiellaceae bacterium]|jgi:catechol 2,3-dioxygenase-like lactoylglutathione lyase family enzyme|nr:VOC family protein [Gaiellaceae bacterium]